MRLAALLTLLLFIALPSRSTAYAGTLWSTPAAACAPLDSSIQSNRYTIVAGSVKFTTSVSPITLFCPVNVPLNPSGPTTVSQLSVLYQDSDGELGGVDISAQLIQMDRVNGSITVLGTFDSSAFSSTGTVQNTTAFPTVTIDKSLYDYYIRVDMQRVTGTTGIFYMAAVST